MIEPEVALFFIPLRKVCQDYYLSITQTHNSAVDKTLAGKGESLRLRITVMSNSSQGPCLPDARPLVNNHLHLQKLGLEWKEEVWNCNATSLCTGARKTFVNRCGNNSPTHMRGDQHTFSCLRGWSFLGFVHAGRRHNASYFQYVLEGVVLHPATKVRNSVIIPHLLPFLFVAGQFIYKLSFHSIIMSHSADNPCIFPFELIIFYTIGFIGKPIFSFSTTTGDTTFAVGMPKKIYRISVNLVLALIRFKP